MAIYLFFPFEIYSAIPALEGFFSQKMTGYMPEKDALIFYLCSTDETFGSALWIF